MKLANITQGVYRTKTEKKQAVEALTKRLNVICDKLRQHYLDNDNRRDGRSSPQTNMYYGLPHGAGQLKAKHIELVHAAYPEMISSISDLEQIIIDYQTIKNTPCAGDNVLKVKQADASVTTSQIEERIQELAQRITEKRTAYYTKSGFKSSNPVVTVEYGRRYAKLITDHSVYCFVDMTNGNVLKAATWKAPVTDNPRANVMDQDFGLSGCDMYGTNYVKG